MDIYKYLKENITENEIIEIMKILGSDYKQDSNGNLKFKTICHGGESYKLYYFLDSKYFRCFTECQENFSLIDLVKKIKNCKTSESIYFIKEKLGIKSIKKQGFKKSNLVSDWDYLKKYNKKNIEIEFKNKVYSEKILDLFPLFCYNKWKEEDIDEDIIIKFNIRFDISNNRIIIPHYNIEGNLIGIRVRNLDEISVLNGYKYMPMEYNNKYYTHKLQYELYGLNKNIENIKRMSKIMIFESEKSVHRADKYYKENNFTVACCGSNISIYQRDLIVNLGIKEVFLAFDKEFTKDETLESEEYAEKIMDKALMFSVYCTVYVLWDKENLLELKDSPIDKGREVLEQLMKNKYEVKTID